MENIHMNVPVRPVMDNDSKPYWESLQNKELKLQKCLECGKVHFPPSPGCPYCGSTDHEWVRISGKGKVYSWTVVNAPISPDLKDDVPFAVGLVELDVGARIVGRIIGCPLGEIRSDMAVRPIYRTIDDELTLICFEPDEAIHLMGGD